MPSLSLLRQGNPLAEPRRQVELLESSGACSVPPFEAMLTAHGLDPLCAQDVRTLQINVGKLCNQTCAHCHVDAGPDRREIMTRETMQDCLAALGRAAIPTVDLTGGAPELNPHFRWFVVEIRRLGRQVIDRCNLTVLTVPGQADLAEFLARHEVEVIASLPCYLEENCDRQRGAGVFQRSLEALRRLNGVGYGRPGSPLRLNLVYNPLGLSLPPDQQRLEAAYRDQLQTRYGIEFHRLYTLTNLPISRFLDDLWRTGRYDDYMQLLASAFNPRAVEGVMCRTTLSVDWQGRLYDCDFNQMLDRPVHQKLPQHIRDFRPEEFAGRPIVTGRHCYGCTAGAGSSCQGALLTGAPT